MPDSDAPTPATIAGEQAETRGHIYDLVSRIASLEGSQKHMASKEDVEKAKIWMIVTISAALVSILALAFNLSRLYVSFRQAF